MWLIVINRLTALLSKHCSNGVLLFQIVTSAKEAVTGAKEAVSGTMNGAKESVSSTLSEVTDRTRGAVQGSMEKTKTVVSGGVQTVMESRVVKLMSSSVDTALSTSETLLEQFLPETEERGEDKGWTMFTGTRYFADI